MKNWATLDADVNKILTKHYTSGRSGAKINKVIVHYNAGNLTVEGCYSVWQTREASAHYQVEDGGRIGQLVWDSDTAWHASNWQANISSIGIEHANRSDGTISEKCLDNGAHLVAAICKYYGLGRPEWLKNVFPHKYFAATSCPGQIYGSQKNAYIQRAQKWYDYMTGSDSSKPANDTPASTAGVKRVANAVYRLYNPNNGTHLFTNSYDEAKSVASYGWNYEGVVWKSGNGDAVERLYNPYNGEHMLTTSTDEHNSLVKAGWVCEGEAFRQGTEVDVYRLYNPNNGLHMFTASTTERDSLVKAGWKNEGVAFKGNKV